MSSPDPSLLYRRALGTFATGVTVITAEDGQGGPGRAVGLTVNSFTSVSLKPPLVLWCLGDASDRRHLFAKAKRWVVNVLAAEDKAHSERFAWGACRLEPGDIAPGAGKGPPRLAGALTSLECKTTKRIQLGDHLVIVGEVKAIETRDGEGLLFFRGGYGRARTDD